MLNSEEDVAEVNTTKRPHAHTVAMVAMVVELIDKNIAVKKQQ